MTKYLERLSCWIYKRKDAIVDSLVILALSFVPFWRMECTGIWKKGHFDFPLYPTEEFVNSLFAWNHQLSTGHKTIITFSIQHLPQKLLWATLTYIGVSLALTQRIYLILIFFLLGSGMRYLVSTVFPCEERGVKRIACMISSIFYMVNPYTIQRLSVELPSFLLSLSIVPFTFTFMFKGLRAVEKGGDWIKYTILTALSSTILLTAHTTVAILMASLFAVYIVYCMLFDLSLRRVNAFINHGKFILTTALASFTANLWWLLGLLYAYVSTQELQEVYAKGEYIQMTLRAHSEGLTHAMEGPVLRLLRLQVVGAPKSALHWWQWVESPISVAIGLTLFFFMIISFIFKSKDKHIVFFLLITLVSTGFATGLNPPFGPIFLWLWDHVGIFATFHGPDKFLQVSCLGYSILLGISTAEIYKRFSSRKLRDLAINPCNKYLRRAIPKVFVSAIIGLIFLNSYPLLSGNLYGVLDPVDVPEYYFEARDWLKQQDGDFRVMMMPQQPWGVQYSWSAYSMVPIAKQVFPFPVIDWIGGYGGPVPQTSHMLNQWLYTSVFSNQTKYVGKMLSLLNVKYIVVADDLVEWSGPEAGEKIDTSLIKSALESKKDLRLVESFGKLHFYENKAYNNSQLYGTTTYFILPQLIEGVFLEWDAYKMLCNYRSFHPSKVALFSPQQLPTQKAILDKAFIISEYITVDWTPVISCDDTEGWVVWFTSSFTADTVDYKEGNASLKAVSNAPSRWPPSQLVHGSLDAGVSWDWSDKNVFGFWFKSNSVEAKYAFELADTYGNGYHFNFAYSKENAWEWIMVPIIGAMADLSKVDKFLIQVIEPTPAINVTYKIDGIQVGETRVELPNNLSEEDNKIQLVYERVNPTRYEVCVNTENPFVLVFSESYDSDWRARVVDDKYYEPNHFIANFYANGWYLEKTGEYTIVIEYEPQKYLNYGIIGSVTSVAIAVAFFTAKKIKDCLKGA